MTSDAPHDLHITSPSPRTISHDFQVREGYDRLVLVDGVNESAGTVLLELPAPTGGDQDGAVGGTQDGATADGAAADGAATAASGAAAGCDGAAGGACVQGVVGAQGVQARSGVAFIRLESRPRTDGTSSRVSLTYMTVGPPEHAASAGGHAGGLRAALTHHPDRPDEVEYASLPVERARGWSSPAADSAPSSWPGEPSEWAESGRRAARVTPLLEDERASRGSSAWPAAYGRPESGWYN